MVGTFQVSFKNLSSVFFTQKTSPKILYGYAILFVLMTFVDHSRSTPASIYIMPGAGDKCHGKEQIYTRAKDPDCTGINQNQHKHGRTVPQAQCSSTDIS